MDDEFNVSALDGADNIVTGDLKQTAVHRVGNAYLLNRRVDYHLLQVFRFDGIYGHRCVDGGFEQQL